MNQRSEYLSYGQQWIDEEDIEAVVKILRSPFITQGPKVMKFEEKVANYVGARYAVAFSSGTAALHGACFAAGIKQGDEVITTPMTFVATSNVVLYCGGKPVFADIDPKTYNIDPIQIEKNITEQTKAIIAVDYTGQPAEMDAISALAKKKNLIVIEDGAHSLGATYKGRKVGTLADMTMFSFHPVKPITTGEGGVIVTDDRDYYHKLKIFRTHGTSPATDQAPWYYEMHELGYNYRMTDLSAALGYSQLDKLDQFISRRTELANLYNDLLANFSNIKLPNQNHNANSGWHLYVIQWKGELFTRREVFDKLRAANIGVHVHYIPAYWHPYYQKLGYKKGLCPVAEELYESIITLPLFPQMSDFDLFDVVKVLKEICG
ncbi:UDP-4-amino-4,6-dideoxy-N-acetyl-beta-L-altrosamine transaminase [Natronobacillus azotifigens]|uniref:UDP-4-amino-4, 6-dideoxy-N-acetyl-beta-L-altrosamine transaminase n=1 Tax=Natronobacillus azotifigens TaxID=472978 RepID=A0A9J6RA09_9BACI|nr:UDP-4-amino-4,6-dideoxy-N-acetyl-beta-L-altrosamine transaminase [Natronobacillus azotifigens]MCZ0702097.1 UDP-4-amino-4,6-dideoxy-N-acetyl-beta-L-altrosamine transaminase [Natronobacillus azotifigens]